MSSYLSKESIKSYITGISFNLANGDDTIVGYQTVKNQFICGNRKKIFIGGELDDVFILLFGKLGTDENKFFDGNSGNDTLYVKQLPYYQIATIDNDRQQTDELIKTVGTFINLQQGELRYLINNYIDDFASVSSLIRKKICNRRLC